ncbi:Protein of unknown function [Gryllus bimaculatus]|nr:Protein of unknown function [Gryllus bimaculatus]
MEIKICFYSIVSRFKNEKCIVKLCIVRKLLRCTFSRCSRVRNISIKCCKLTRRDTIAVEAVRALRRRYLPRLQCAKYKQF